MKTKIVATIGPASLDKAIMAQMIHAGVSVARINTKYGSIAQYEQIIKNLQEIGGCELLFDFKDHEKFDWLLRQNFDYLALSFAESADQITSLREKFKPREIKIIAKIESDNGLKNIDEIIDASDGIMIARGDLGKNIPFEKVPIEQKIIIKKCNEKGKLVITATEMLLSMVASTVPERAEASDVANAVLDGSNYLMLSEETATGKYPVLAVEAMAKIISETEKDSKLLE